MKRELLHKKFADGIFRLTPSSSALPIPCQPGTQDPWPDSPAGGWERGLQCTVHLGSEAGAPGLSWMDRLPWVAPCSTLLRTCQRPPCVCLQFTCTHGASQENILLDNPLSLLPVTWKPSLPKKGVLMFGSYVNIFCKGGRASKLIFKTSEIGKTFFF